MALVHGSLAIGAGAALGQTTDQRGFPLDSPKPDIGAFQTQPGIVVTTTGDNGAPSGRLDLREAVNLANVLDAAATITFDPTAFAAHQTISLTAGPLVLSDIAGLQTITAPAAGLTISAGGLSRDVQVESGVTASFSGLTLTGGSAPTGGGGGVENLGTATLTDCTIRGNSAFTGGGVENLGKATLAGCTISGNSALQYGFLPGVGGGVYNKGTATLTACTLSGNSADNGGGVYNKGTLTLTGCTISGNSVLVTVGGGVDNDGTLTIGDTIVAGNTAPFGPDVDGTVTTDLGYNLVGDTSSSGGFTAATDLLNKAAGLAPLGDYGGPTQTMALVHGSLAIGHGAAMGQTTDQRGFALDSPKPDIGAFQTQPGIVVNTTLDGDSTPLGELSLRQALNLAGAQGTATITFDPTAFAAHQTIALTAGPLELSDTGGLEKITGPAAGLTIDAGGKSDVLQVDNGVTASLSGLTFSGGSGASVGGIANYGDLTLAGCTISGNSGAVVGGIANAGKLTLTTCTVSGNSGSDGVGGIGNYNYGQMKLTECTISGNSSLSRSGGGVYNIGTAKLYDCTVSGNSASKDGGGLFDEQGTLTLTACTVSGNSAGQSGGGVYVAISEGLALGDTILAGNTARTGPDLAGAVSITDLGHNLIGGDPLLAPLGDYGGPTQTMALLPGSPAIGVGAAMGQTTDQRGLIRGNVVDIGAFQSSLEVESPAGSSNTTAAGLTLPGAVSLADQFADEAISFDPAAFSAPTTITLAGAPLELSNTALATTITGPAASLTINGGTSGVFRFDPGVTASLSGLTLMGSGTGTGITENGGSLDVKAMSITGFATGIAVSAGGAATITDSNVTGDTTGIAVGSSSTDTATLTAANDSFAGDAIGVQDNQSTGSASATLDWWGSATGPANSTNPAGTGAKAVGNVAFSPWLGDTAITAPDYLVFLSNAGNQYAVSPGAGNTSLDVTLGGTAVGSITGGGTLGFAGTGGTITVYGESGAGSTDVLNVSSKSVQFNADDGMKGSTIDFLGTGLTRNVVAQGTTNTFNIQGSGTGGTPGSLVGDSGTNAFVFATAATLAGGIQGGGSSTLNYSAYTTGVTVNLGNGTNGTATGVSGSVAGIAALIGGRGNDTLNAGSVPGVALTGGPGINTLSGTGAGDSVAESLSSSYTLTNARLTGASPSFIDILSGIAIADLTGSSATANTFTVTGWTGTGSLTVPAGTGMVIDSAAGSFILTNAQLKAPNTTLALNGIAAAKLTDNSATGGNTFTVTGWTGGGTLRGTSETLVDAAAGGFALSNTGLSSTADGSLTLTGFKTANLTDTSTGGNTFTVTGWTGGGSLTGPTGTGATADMVVDAAPGNFTLSNTLLSIGRLSMALSGITTANLTDTGSGHTFTVNGWTGAGSLGSSVTGNTETLTASETAGLTLANTSLALSGGGTMSLASFKAAKLTVTTASGSPQYIVDVSGFSNGPTNVTINGGGNAIVYGGTAGRSTLTAAGSGNDILIGAGAGDKLTDSGSGMNILIGGGPGGDVLTGNGNDILVSGTTSYDADNAANIAALDAILAEWTSSDSYFARIGKILAGVGALGADALNSSTVPQDAKANTLQDASTQTQNNNCFLAWSNDVVKKNASETKIVL
jgi:hypothetical protein